MQISELDVSVDRILNTAFSDAMNALGARPGLAPMAWRATVLPLRQHGVHSSSCAYARSRSAAVAGFTISLRWM